MSNWYMLSLIGKDKPGIVAQVTRVLFENDANLGEASMQRLGGYFAIMLMFSSDESLNNISQKIRSVATAQDLTMHIDPFDGHLHQHLEADVCVSLYGADRVGIVATATEKLASAGLHILALHTDVGGTEGQPIFVLEIEGHATQGLKAIEQAVSSMQDFDVHVTAIDTLIA